jgi:hypothetical protein
VLYPASPGRATPESGQQDLKEKAGQARDIGPLAGQVFSEDECIRMANGPASSY